MSSGFNLQDFGPTQKVILAAANDSQMEDEALNPPLFRERYMDQANISLIGDYSNQINPAANTAQWNIGSDVAQGAKNNAFFSARIKKFMPNFVQMSLYAPNINPRNNIIEFQVNGDVSNTFVATIPVNNYTRLITDWCDKPVAAPATYAAFLLPANGYAPPDTMIDGDPKDGLIDWICWAMNHAVNKATGVAYNPAILGNGQFLSGFSNGYFDGVLPNNNCYRYRNTHTGENLISGDAKFGRITCAGVAPNPITNISFRFVGGNTFVKGLHAWGPDPLPRGITPSSPAADFPFYNYYFFGPCQLQYTRYIDILCPELVQFSKMRNTGCAIPGGHLIRLYRETSKIGLDNTILDGFRQQQINMRKDYPLNYLSLEVRDEYGELYEMPTHIPSESGEPNSYDVWPNTNGIAINLLAQL